MKYWGQTAEEQERDREDARKLEDLGIDRLSRIKGLQAGQDVLVPSDLGIKIRM